MCLGTVINGANVTPEVATHRSRHRFGFGSCWLGLSWGTLLSPSSSSVGCCGCFAFTVSLVCNAPFSLATAFFRIFPSFCASCVWFCHLCNRWQIRTKRVWLFLLYVRGASVCVWRVIVVDFYLVFHKAVEMVLQLSGLPTSLPLQLYFCLFLSVSLSIYCHYVAHDDIYDYCYKIWIDSLGDRRSRLRRHRQRQRFPWPSEDDFQLETVCVSALKTIKISSDNWMANRQKETQHKTNSRTAGKTESFAPSPFCFPRATGSVTQLLTNCYISVEHWTTFEERNVPSSMVVFANSAKRNKCGASVQLDSTWSYSHFIRSKTNKALLFL